VKKPSGSVSDVVKEIDESPEWKNLIEEEEEGLPTFLF